MVALTPLMFGDMGKAWHQGAFMTDASWWGGAALHTQATVEELREEARAVSPNGWFTKLALEEESLSRGGAHQCPCAGWTSDGGQGCDAREVADKFPHLHLQAETHPRWAADDIACVVMPRDGCVAVAHREGRVHCRLAPLLEPPHVGAASKAQKCGTREVGVDDGR